MASNFGLTNMADFKIEITLADIVAAGSIEAAIIAACEGSSGACGPQSSLPPGCEAQGNDYNSDEFQSNWARVQGAQP